MLMIAHKYTHFAQSSPTSRAPCSSLSQIFSHTFIQLLSQIRPNPSAVSFSHPQRSLLLKSPWNPESCTMSCRCLYLYRIKIVGSITSSYSHSPQHILCDNLYLWQFFASPKSNFLC